MHTIYKEKHIHTHIFTNKIQTHTHTLTNQHTQTHTQRTMKKVMVLPPWMVPYSMLVWSARSSGEPMGTSILWTVRKAARLAV